MPEPSGNPVVGSPQGIEDRAGAEWLEVVAMRIAGAEKDIVTNDLGEIWKAVAEDRDMHFITRHTAQDMLKRGKGKDWGENWAGLANARPIFYIDEEGNLYGAGKERLEAVH